MTKGERIKSLREGIGMSQTDLADKLDTKKQTIYKYETGIVTNIPSDKIEMMAKIFNVSPAYIMGWSNDKNPKTPSNIFPVDASRFYNVPIIGRVAAGLNCFADTNTVGYQPTDAAVLTGSEPYVYLRVVGDSMYPKFEEGDLVLVRCQPSVNSGAIAVVIIDDEDGIIKRIIYGDDWIELHSINPLYPVRRFDGEDVLRVRVFGLVRQCVRNFS